MLVDRLPYVTLLLRVRGNTEVERRALDRRREFDRVVAGLVKEAEAEGDIRADVEPAVTARLLFGMVNSIVEWYKPHGEDGSRRLANAVCAVAWPPRHRGDHGLGHGCQRQDDRVVVLR